MANRNPSQCHKILVLGDGGVGKTSVITRFTTGASTNSSLHGDGVYYKTATYKGQALRLEITEGPSRDESTSLRQVAIRDAEAILILYSLTDRRSFDNIGVLVEEVRKERKQDIEIEIVGNKTDIRGELGQVSPGEGRSKARKLGSGFAECSAEDGTGVEELFMDLVGRLEKQDEDEDDEEGIKGEKAVGKGKDNKQGSFMVKVLDLVTSSLHKAQG